MTLQVLDSSGAKQNLSTTFDDTGQALVGSTCVADPTSGKKAGVSPFGELAVTTDTTTPTYRAAKLALTPVASPTDVFVIQGSATKTVRIKKIKLSGVATAQGNMPVQIVRRSSAGTPGSAVLTAITAVKHDTNDAAATAVISSVGTANYTTLGTLVGVLGAKRLSMPASGSGAAGDGAETSFDFCRNADKALVLRGTSDFICVNFNGAAVPAGGVVDFEIEFEEDAS